MSTVVSPDGSFRDCASCPSQNNCCVRERRGGYGRVVAPFLLPSEAEVIGRHKQLDTSSFWEIVENENGMATHELRTVKNQCYFYDNGRCGIYRIRPIDCRLFPFDIVEREDGSFWWIVYLKLCPVNFRFERYFEFAKRTLAESGWSETELHQFASHKASDMIKHEHQVLEQVDR